MIDMMENSYLEKDKGKLPLLYIALVSALDYYTALSDFWQREWLVCAHVVENCVLKKVLLLKLYSCIRAANPLCLC